ncbi:MAG TPA: hypothetical protein VGZ29_05485 [Terriglobia bacterium]|nr:hypothetical protein [Terriglobia bacterium]
MPERAGLVPFAGPGGAGVVHRKRAARPEGGENSPTNEAGSGVRIYRYAAKLVVPRRLQITNGLGWGLVLHNPVPSRRRRVGWAWIPEVEYLEGALPRARRVRGGGKPGMAIFHSGAESPREGRRPGNESETRGGLEPKPSRWGAIFRAVGGIGSSILGGLGGSARRGDPVPAPPCWDQEGPGVVDFGSSRGEPWDDPADYESESPEEFLFRHRLLARIAMAAARRSRRL